METGHEEHDPPPRYHEEPPSSDLPTDFSGEVDTNNVIPTQEDLDRVANLLVLDSSGQSRPFKDLHSGPNVAKRQLIIFVRHFFCGNCQQYLRALSRDISTDELLRLEEPAFIVVIGCGRPELIEMYRRETECQFPIYADPTRQLYDELGMTRTLELGSKPAYMDKSLAAGTAKSIVQAVKSRSKVLSGGSWNQVGGEFFFESGEVTWCHRMRTTRDHAEVSELRDVIGLPVVPEPPKTDPNVKKANRRSIFGGISRRNTESALAPQTHKNGTATKAEPTTNGSEDEPKPEGQ